jgi:hypothetical protein
VRKYAFIKLYEKTEIGVNKASPENLIESLTYFGSLERELAERIKKLNVVDGSEIQALMKYCTGIS